MGILSSKKINILDCTLRDGGYVNDWNFGSSVILDVYRRLDNAGMEFIEVGFLDDRVDLDKNRTIAPDIQSLNEVYKNIVCKNAVPVAMIDYGTCDINNISDASESFVKGIRVIFKKEKIQEALPYCKAIKDKGYLLFIQAISITAYSDEEMLDYVSKINEIEPYAFSIVDTYGLLDSEKLEHYFHLIDDNLKDTISLGYHSHNNFQLAFSNTIAFLKLFTGKRNLIADSTVYGMGKSAGNCATELLSMHMNSNYDKNYDLSAILEIVDTDLMPIYLKNYWGYKYNFYIAAMQNCHPNYVQYLLDKNTLSVKSVNEILSEIPGDKKLLYDESYIIDAYTNYQENNVDDSWTYETLKKVMSDEVTIIGPGSSVKEEKSRIEEFIDNSKNTIISVNFIPEDYNCNFVFVSNAKRYSQFVDTIGNNTKLIATSNVEAAAYAIDYYLNYASLLSMTLNNSDNALLLLLNFLIKLGVKKVNLIGFDGFSPYKHNYYKQKRNFALDVDSAFMKNDRVSAELKIISKSLELNFITDTLYNIGSMI